MLLRESSAAFDLSGAVQDNVEGPFSDNSRIELFQGSCGRIPWIGEGIFAGRLTFGIEFLETIFGEINFAANFEQRRRCSAGSPQPSRNGPDGSEIGGDIVASGSIAAGRSTGEDAFFISEIDGHSVHLWFDNPVELLIRQQALDSLHKLAQFFLRI